ncbi:hypothetical protein ELI02_12800 [Rhizobium leguminosarum]|nr:hypothetical protein ELI02_12800 [Rhizobium leguminosarum]
MIRSSACQRQADPFPALSGRHGERRSYTTPWDTIQQFVFRGYAISKFRFEKGKRGTLFFRVCNSVAAPKAGTSKDRPDKADVG